MGVPHAEIVLTIIFDKNDPCGCALLSRGEQMQLISDLLTLSPHMYTHPMVVYLTYYIVSICQNNSQESLHDQEMLPV